MITIEKFMVSFLGGKINEKNKLNQSIIFIRFALKQISNRISVWILPTVLKVTQALKGKGPSFCSHFEFEFYQNDANEEMIQILFEKTSVQI